MKLLIFTKDPYSNEHTHYTEWDQIGIIEGAWLLRDAYVVPWLYANYPDHTLIGYEVIDREHMPVEQFLSKHEGCNESCDICQGKHNR